ncbi:MAG: 50S ribosomal protein L32 [Caldilineaceae bacterium]
MIQFIEESKRNGTASKTKSQQRPAQSPPRPRCHRRAQAGCVLQLPRSPMMPHRVCPTCGYYKGRQIIDVDAE